MHAFPAESGHDAALPTESPVVCPDEPNYWNKPILVPTEVLMMDIVPSVCALQMHSSCKVPQPDVSIHGSTHPFFLIEKLRVPAGMQQVEILFTTSEFLHFLGIYSRGGAQTKEVNVATICTSNDITGKYASSSKAPTQDQLPDRFE